MPLLADRVRETTTTTGTGPLTLGGAVTGYQAFNTAFTNGQTVYYVVQYGAEWEIGIGTVGAGTLARTTVLQSSNADALVNLSAGTKDVFVAYVADRAVTTVDAATLTNKTISGADNTLTNIANASLTNSSVTINGTTVALGASATVTAAAGTLTGTTLASGVTASSLTSVGTLTSLAVSGNVAVGVTGSAWSSSYSSIDFRGASLFGSTNATEASLAGNAFVSTGGVYTYKASNLASLYQQVLGEHRFSTAASGTAGNTITFTRALTIDANGNVGIGVTAPATRLEVGSATTTQLRVRMTGQADVRLISDTGYGALSNDSAMPLYFRTSGANRWHIDATGHLLASTDASFDIGASGANRPRNVFVSTAVITPTVTNAGALALSTSTAASISLNPNGTDRFNISSAGRATFIPQESTGVFSASVQLVTPNDNVVLRLAMGRTSYYLANIAVGKDSATADSTATYLAFETRNAAGTLAERVRIDSVGNVGIGVIPSGWSGLGSGSSARALQLFSAAIVSTPTGGADTTTYVTNAFFDGTNWIYRASNPSTRYDQWAGENRWFTAPSGTAGNAITFTERMRLDASGNLGLGVTPSAWSGFRALQNGRAAFVNASDDTLVAHNWFWNGTSNVYVNTDFATQYRQQSGRHIWYTAPSGTAGNAITFTQAMTLDAAGNLVVGGSTASARLHVRGTTTIPTIIESTSQTESYLRFINTADNSIYVGSSGSSLLLLTGSTTRWQVNSSGHFLAGADATYDIGASGANRPRDLFVARNMSVDNTTFYVDATNDRVGVRTTTPTAAFEVKAAGKAMVIDSGAANDSRLEMAYNGTTQGLFGVDNGQIIVRASAGNFLALGAGNTERARVKAAGQVRFIPLSADPSGAEAGDVYYNSTSNKLKVYDGTSWVDLH